MSIGGGRVDCRRFEIQSHPLHFIFPHTVKHDPQGQVVWATGVVGDFFSVYVNDIAYHNGRVYFSGEHVGPAWGWVDVERQWKA